MNTYVNTEDRVKKKPNWTMAGFRGGIRGVVQPEGFLDQVQNPYGDTGE